MTRVCRACLQIIINAECYSLNQSYPNSECSLLKNRCKACIPEMDLDLTNDPVLCGQCYSTFTLFYHLRLKCLETEKKLRNVLQEKNYIDLGALVQQSQITVNPFLFNDNQSSLPNENVSNFFNTHNNEPTIKQECETIDIASTNVPEEVSDMETIFDHVTDVNEPQKECDINSDLIYNTQDDKVENINRLENSRKSNGSIRSVGSSDFFMESKFSTNSLKKKAFKCLDCDYSTSHRMNLQNHIQSHFGNKPYKCNLCGYRALHKYFLKSHMTMHSGSKPFKCSQCDYKTAYRGNLQTHLRKHTGEKPYKCDICNNTYTQSNSLNRHVKTHANAKPLKCCLCEYRTMYKSHLRNHMMLHTGEKLYTCDVCKQKFTDKLSLTRHVKEHSIQNM